MNRTIAQPPTERVNISYRSKHDSAQAETELPLKMLVVGDFSGQKSETSIEERPTYAVDRERFDEVMQSHNLRLAIEVDNHLDGVRGAAEQATRQNPSLALTLAFDKLADFAPESLCQQSEPLRRLLELRQALVALKGPLGNFPQFRRKLEQLLRDPELRERLVQELSHAGNASAETAPSTPRNAQLTAHNNDATASED